MIYSCTCFILRTIASQKKLFFFFQSSLFQILKPLSISCEIIKLNSWRGIAFSVTYGFLSKYQANSCVPTSIFFCCLCFSFVWRSMSFLTTFTIKTFLSEEKACFLKKKKETNYESGAFWALRVLRFNPFPFHGRIFARKFKKKHQNKFLGGIRATRTYCFLIDYLNQMIVKHNTNRAVYLSFCEKVIIQCPTTSVKLF